LNVQGRIYCSARVAETLVSRKRAISTSLSLCSLQNITSNGIENSSRAIRQQSRAKQQEAQATMVLFRSTTSSNLHATASGSFAHPEDEHHSTIDASYSVEEKSSINLSPYLVDYPPASITCTRGSCSSKRTMPYKPFASGTTASAYCLPPPPRLPHTLELEEGRYFLTFCDLNPIPEEQEQECPLRTAVRWVRPRSEYHF